MACSGDCVLEKSKYCVDIIGGCSVILNHSLLCFIDFGVYVYQLLSRVLQYPSIIVDIKFSPFNYHVFETLLLGATYLGLLFP